MPESLYKYIWKVSPRGQIVLIVLALFVFPLSMVPLELQRRIVDEAIKGEDLDLLLLLCGGYLVFIVVQGVIKYFMNMQRGRVVQQAAAHLREAIYYCIYSVVSPRDWRRNGGAPPNQGTVVSMLAAEAERIGQFIGGSYSTPVLQGGTMLAVLGYMVWVEPMVALIGFAIYSPQMIFIPLIQRRINRHNEAYAERVRALGDFVVENAETAEEQTAVPDAFSTIVNQIFDSKMQAVRLKFLMKFLRNFVNNLGPLSILLIGGWFVIQGKTELGTIVAFLSGFERIRDPWSELISFYRQVSNARMKYQMLVDAFPNPPGAVGPMPRPEYA